MASGVYDDGFEDIMDGSLDWGADVIKVILVKSSHAFSATDSFVADVVADEVAGTGYSRKTLGSKTEAYNAGARQYRFDGANVVWTSIEDDLSESTKAAIVYKEVTTDADSILLAYIEDPVTLTFNDGQVTLAFDATGVIRVSA